MRVYVRVKTGTKKEFVKQLDDTHFVVAVSVRPEKGKANEAVLRALSEHLKIPFWRFGIISGHTSKEKVIEITL